MSRQDTAKASKNRNNRMDNFIWTAKNVGEGINLNENGVLTAIQFSKTVFLLEKIPPCF